MISLNKITKKGKAMYLAYDQGLEHGPESDFNDKNIDPLYILEIAKKGGFTGIIFHKGIAEKYSVEIKKSKIPLIIKLNGKTRLVKGEPISSIICSVKEAVSLGAKGVGFTIYIGSKYESKIIEDFGKIQHEAHKYKIPVIAWIYPRGKSIKNDLSRENLVYASRVGLEVGADIIKLKYNRKKSDLKRMVEVAGKAKIVVAGGSKKNEEDFIKEVKEAMDSGVIGIAVGRNVWQSKDPIKLSKKLGKIIFK